MVTKLVNLLFQNRIFIFVLGAGLAVGVFWSLLQLPFDPFGLQQSVVKAAPVVASRFTGAELQGVVTVNKGVEAEGVELRVHTVEFYNDGFSVTYGIYSFGSLEGPMLLEPEYIQASDNAGTPYRQTYDASSRAIGSGLTRGYVTFTPGIGEKTESIKLSVPHMLILGAGDGAQPRVIDGPWEIEVKAR